MFLTTVALALILAIGPASAQTPAPPPPAPVGATLDELLAKADRPGGVPLIVGLRTAAPFTPEPRLPSAAAVSGQKNAIARAQTGLLSALAAHNKRVNARYKHVPYMALTLDRAALEKLIASGLVDTIREDVPVPPAMTAETALIRADSLWASGDDGDGWIVAILDTGIDETHPYFSGRINQPFQACFSNGAGGGISMCPGGSPTQTGANAASVALSGCPAGLCDHGTHVAGIAAGNATGLSGAPGSGVAPHAMILPIQIFTRGANGSAFCNGGSACVASYTSDYVAALDYVYDIQGGIPGRKVAAVNLSIAGGSAVTAACDGDPAKPFIDNLLGAGIPTVIAAGNTYSLTGIQNPGCISSAVTVGAVDNGDQVADFSNRSTTLLDLFAPGVNILSSLPAGTYDDMSGTSMAAPMVTGAFAALREGRPSASVTALLAALKSTGEPVNVGGTNIARVDLRAALNQLDGVDNPPRVPSSPNPANALGGFAPTTGMAWTGGDPDSGDTVHYDVYLGTTNPPAATLAGCTNLATAICTHPALSGATTYYWRVVAADNHGASTNGPVWSFTTTGGSTAPPNDDIANAIVIGGDAFSYGETIAAATTAPGDPGFSCAAGTPHFNSVWYRFTPASSGVLSADTYGSLPDTLLAVYGGSPGALTEIACNDDSDGGRSSVLSSVPLTGGEAVYIEVANYFSNASGTVYLHTTYALLNHNPDPPSNPTPADGGGPVSLNPSLGWTGSDPDGDPLTYDVYAGASSPPLAKVCSTASEGCTPSPALPDNATIYWQVVARDNHAGTAPGPIWTFTTHNNPPAAPSGPGPIDGALDVSLTPTLTWAGSDPDAGDTVTYRVYLDQADTPSTLVPGCDGIAAASCSIPSHLAAGTGYHWKVIATDNHGASTGSPAWAFTTINHAPDLASSPSPIDGAGEVSLNPTLTWAGSDPDAGDALTYDVRFGTDNPPASTAPGCTGLSAASCAAPAPLTDGLTYYWQVVATDPHGASTGGPVWSFAALNHAPALPSSPSPADGANEVSLDKTLSWSGSDPDQGDSLRYTVYLGPDNPPASAAAGCVAVDAARCKPPAPLADGVTTYWRVVAVDNHGASTEGPVWRLDAHNHPPAEPAAPSPAASANGVSASQPFTWTGGDPDEGDAAHYDVYLDTTADPSTPLPECAALAAPACTPTHLAGATTYRWKVIATDTHGASTAGPIWTFTTTNHPPTIPSSPSPASGQTWVGQTPALGWSAPDPDPGDTVTYSVYLSKGTKPKTLVCSGLTSPGCTPSLSLAARTKYAWKVVATDSHGAAVTGPVWTFTTLFDAPIPRAPKDGRPTTRSSIALKWKGYRGAGGYLVELVNLADPGTVITLASARPGVTFRPPAFGVYRWQVRVKDAFGQSALSPALTFEYTLNKSPKNGSLSKSTTPKFAWQAVRGATYLLEFSTDPGFPADTRTVRITTTKAGYPVPKATPLSHGLVYYWRLSTNGGTWTPTWSFSVK